MSKKPIEITRYLCPYCKDPLNRSEFEIIDECLEHIPDCSYNPKNKSCRICRHWGPHQEVLKDEYLSEKPCYLESDCSNGSRWEEVKDEYFEFEED